MEKTLYNPIFCIDSEFEVSLDVTHRYRELEPQTGKTNQSLKLESRPDKTEPNRKWDSEKF